MPYSLDSDWGRLTRKSTSRRQTSTRRLAPFQIDFLRPFKHFAPFQDDAAGMDAVCTKPFERATIDEVPSLHFVCQLKKCRPLKIAPLHDILPLYILQPLSRLFVPPFMTFAPLSLLPRLDFLRTLPLTHMTLHPLRQDIAHPCPLPARKIPAT